MKYYLTIIYLLVIININQGQVVKPVVLIKGKVYNERNLKPLGAIIKYESLPEGAEAGVARSNPATGDYKIVLPYGKNYGFYALIEGYYSITQNLDVRNLTEYKEIDENNLFLAPVEIDQVARINNLFFEPNSAILKPESYPELKRFIEFLKVNAKIEIEISGHYFDNEDATKNAEISEQRAKTVANYLTNNGIKADRIEIKGYGNTQPITFTKNTEDKERNNRIEFKVLSLTKRKK